MKRALFLTLALAALLTRPAAAQKFAIGAGYELQNADPTTGQSLRLESRLLNLKIVSFHTRLQATRFTEDLSIPDPQTTTDVVAEAQAFDFTAAGMAYFHIPILPVDPYVGVGVGFDRSKFNVVGAAQNGIEDEAKSAIAYSTIIGLRLGMIPFVKPFAEYRFAGLTKEPPTQLDKATGRFSFGVAIAF